MTITSPHAYLYHSTKQCNFLLAKNDDAEKKEEAEKRRKWVTGAQD